MKNVNMSFFKYYALLLFFFRTALQDMAKNNPTEKQMNAEIQATLKHAPAWKLTEEKIPTLLLQIATTHLNYKL